MGRFWPMVSARSYLCDGSRCVSAGHDSRRHRFLPRIAMQLWAGRQVRSFSPRLVEEQALHGCAIGQRPPGLVHHPSHAVEELHHHPAHRVRANAGISRSAALARSRVRAVPPVTSGRRCSRWCAGRAKARVFSRTGTLRRPVPSPCREDRGFQVSNRCPCVGGCVSGLLSRTLSVQELEAARRLRPEA